VYQVPESSGPVRGIPLDPVDRGRRCLFPAFLCGLLTVAVWLFRDWSDIIRYGMLLPAFAGAGLGGYAMAQFKRRGGSVGLRLLAFVVMALSMFPLVHTMEWWIDH
jgi:hypothetical protein